PASFLGHCVYRLRFKVALPSGADLTRNCKWFRRVARLRRIPQATAVVHPNHRRGNERPRRKASRPPLPSQIARNRQATSTLERPKLQYRASWGRDYLAIAAIL